MHDTQDDQSNRENCASNGCSQSAHSPPNAYDRISIVSQEREEDEPMYDENNNRLNGNPFASEELERPIRVEQTEPESSPLDEHTLDDIEFIVDAYLLIEKARNVLQSLCT